MIKAIRNKTKTIYAEDFCQIKHVTANVDHLIFKDKIISIVGVDAPYEYYDDLVEYLKSPTSTAFDLPDLEICELFNYDNIVYNIHSVMDEYQITDSEMIVSFGAALVFHDIVEVCNDIDVFITPECSYRLEDEYGIRRIEAPMKNTSKQTVHNIDMFALDGTAHVYTKYHKYSDYPISVEMLDSLIKTYKDRANGPNREKYLLKIEMIKDKLAR